METAVFSEVTFNADAPVVIDSIGVIFCCTSSSVKSSVFATMVESWSKRAVCTAVDEVLLDKRRREPPVDAFVVLADARAVPGLG